MNQWDERYAGESFHFGTMPNAFLAAQRHRLPARGLALAVADGEGRNGVWLAEQGLDVLAVDASPVGLDKSRRLAAGRGVSLRYELADLATWDFGRERFDVIVAIFIQFAAPALRTRIFAGLGDALKPGGLLLLEGYRPEQLAYGTGGPPIAENLYTEAMLRQGFASLQIDELAAYDAPIHEGRGHDGMSALIDLVARKPLR
ncbi:SAM-dependent methyltransferase [Rhodanobacter thiooxydans]|uniref:SAM-dependent methyltransferase n=1 Tax=Rhodanobacter thiooxydans TaxID=416169 RepID=A0A154QGV8_9GAMM|nr:class I SAM-dependent methyltransferase [Rhodanobacter thiooxydans]EIM02587.1 methyltransferase type 11 [Rhodanobacter thiooxydans LCS2]KZC23479.1 SAM-dependent methyltransferase [Rhodanobacter thiooxydans]MCW0200892.1 class I SAM-dependent methyltransferase [Rhodanobacter thiooxydans]